MDISLDEINPSSLVDFTHRENDESLSLQASNIINEIAQSLYRVAESHIEPLPNLSELTQQLNNNRLASNNRNNSNPNNETDSNATSQEQSNENNQFIDLTKEQDDILIISDSPRENRSTRRTIRKATIRPPQRSQLNESNDEIEVISTQRRTRRTADNPNETIILDDDRNENPNEIINNSTTSASQDTDIVQICSPLKKQKTDSVTNNISDSENDEIPKCPLCLENLTELKQRNKKLVATPCGHVVCNKCLDEYFKSTSTGAKTALCPTCRTKLTKSKMITLFL